MTKWVYKFGDGKAEGHASDRNLLGGREPGLILGTVKKAGVLEIKTETETVQKKPQRPPREGIILPEEAANHEAFLKTLKNPMWLN